jgi:hypothetical protein
VGNTRASKIYETKKQPNEKKFRYGNHRDEVWEFSAPLKKTSGKAKKYR